MSRPFVLLLALLSFLTISAQHRLPDGVTVCGGNMHVQGIAVDTLRQCMYFSFTTQFIRTDLEGHVLGTVDRIPGHLGAIALDPTDGRVYASLEYKDDEIGRGIAQRLGTGDYTRQGSVFSIAVIDGPHLTREGMTMDDGVFSTVRLPDVIRDYCDSVSLAGTLTPHRYACSGIDGVAFAPAPGKPHGRRYLYVAYGIYGDTTRTDNDCQVLLRYDISRWTPRTADARPVARYFVPTGNTTYGVQNMAFDTASSTLLLAVYPGRKAHLPNYDLYGVDLSQRSRKATLEGVPYATHRVRMLPLSPYGEGSGSIRGWRNRWGSTGMAPLGDSLFMLSQDSHQPDGTQCCTLHLVRFTPTSATPFLPLK